MKYQVIIVSCLWVFMVVSLICSVYMLIEIFRKGDERANFILMRTSINTVKVYLIFLLITFVYNTFLERYTNFIIRDNSIIYICVLALIFTIMLFINKKKHGVTL